MNKAPNWLTVVISLALFAIASYLVPFSSLSSYCDAVASEVICIVYGVQFLQINAPVALLEAIIAYLATDIVMSTARRTRAKKR
jgi:hypothetical protein